MSRNKAPKVDEPKIDTPANEPAPDGDQEKDLEPNGAQDDGVQPDEPKEPVKTTKKITDPKPDIKGKVKIVASVNINMSKIIRFNAKEPRYLTKDEWKEMMVNNPNLRLFVARGVIKVG